MKLPVTVACRRAFFFRAFRNLQQTIQRGYCGGPDPELMKIHNKLPPNYKSHAGQINIDQPAFFYDWVFTKPADPNMKIPEWSYRADVNPSVPLWYGEHMSWKILSTLAWGWIIWRMYWGGYNVFLGEPEFTSAPDPSSFTDEELGIPNDDTMPVRIY